MAERADATRNRRAVLAAAGRLFDDAADPGAVTMDDVARLAGVGKGTLFRRFGDRAALVRAVYDERLSDLRVAIESGPPPVGPSAEPRQRIPALLEAIVDFKLDNRRLAVALEVHSGGTPELYRSDGYAFIHDLLVGLLAETAGPDEATWLAYALLAVTRIDLVDHLVTSEGMSRKHLHAQVRLFVARVLRRDTPHSSG